MKPLIELHGGFTYARLRARGYTGPQIQEGIRQGFLNAKETGVLVTESRKRKQLLNNSLIGYSPLNEEDDIQPGQLVARVIDGEIQKLQVVRDEGRELAVIDPDNKERIINVDKEQLANIEDEERDRQSEPGIYGENQNRQNWLATGRSRTGDENLKEGEKIYTVDDEIADEDKPYTVGESEQDEGGGGDGGDDFQHKRVGVIKSLRAMHQRIQTAEAKLHTRLARRMQELMDDYDVTEDEYLHYNESVDAFGACLDNFLLESIRPRELPEDLQSQYTSLMRQARDGMDGEEAVCMYYPSFQEDSSGRLAVVRDSQIEQEMANGALVVNETIIP